MCIHMHISIYFISTRITIKRILAFYQLDPENQKCAYIIHSFSNVRRLNANVVTQKDGFPLQLHVRSEAWDECIYQ